MAKADKQFSNPFGVTFGEAPEPPQSRETTDWAGIAEVLRANPGRWAKVKTYDSRDGVNGHYQTIKRGTKHLPAGEFDVRYQRAGDKENGTSELWLCYVGGSVAPEQAAS